MITILPGLYRSPHCLQTFINPSPNTCTSLIVNATLDGKHCLWAICGAFGDNLHQLANQHAKRPGPDRTADRGNYRSWVNCSIITAMEQLSRISTIIPGIFIKRLQPVHQPFCFPGKFNRTCLSANGIQRRYCLGYAGKRNENTWQKQSIYLA